MSAKGFTIVIACEHSSGSLSATLSALRESDQTQSIQAIVVDCKASDERRRVVDAALTSGMDLRYRSLPGVSKAGAWNTAVAESSTEYVAFLDDDCVPPPGWLTAFEKAFDVRTGIMGGPDRVPPDAPLFERCLDYVLTSTFGTLGMRRGSGAFAKYYPRPWNMAARVEAVLLARGFSEKTPEAPEAPMIRRMEELGYTTSYAPDAWVYHHRETTFRRFTARDFRLSAERARLTSQPGLTRIYTAALLGLAVLFALALTPTLHHIALPMVGYLATLYAGALVFSGVHSGIRMRSPAVGICVPAVMMAHHIAHLTGYAFGRVTRLLRTR